ncbi:hypothetical protein QJS10_CPA05g01994 [Acorus calamus]|uniref:WW domain-containing protein n=1 Tax=Acorus calamus TaxID=4465 RepID=A0AAV9ERL0_ACOCL|nr:hypothetical protein QJS10_CPA05g01994 [Acorus calamus]
MEVAAGNCCLLDRQPENPLLLLGQYSDDELDEETNESQKCDERESSPDDQNGDENNSLHAKNEEDRSNEPRNNVSSDVKQENGEVDAKKHVNANVIGVSDLTSVTTPCSQADATTQVCVSDSSGIQIAGDLADGWKIVMLEENGSYYYWNTVTGETSWEVPVIMTQGTDTSDALVHENYSTANGNGSTHMITESDEKNNVVLNAGEDEGHECQNQEILNSVESSNQTVAKGGSTEVCVLYDQAAERSRLIASQQSSSSAMELKGMEATGKDPFIPTSGENKGESNENLETAQLVDYSESLLKRLQSLARSGCCTRGQDWTSKCITEVEIRLADCTTLSPYGSSLLPFWCHIETQLKQLEVIIIEEEASLVLKSKDPTKVENEHIIMHGLTNVSLPSVSLEVNDVEKGSGVEYMTAENALSSHGANNVEVQNEINHVVSCKGTPEGIHDNELEAKMKQETSENAISSPSVYKMNPHDGEDIDMDVEMEVDEGTTVDHTVSEEPSTAECSASQEHQFNFYPPSFAGTPAAPCDECIAPPPPDEEWIPPPPPDYEPIPPPPPEEPPTSSYPPPPPKNHLHLHILHLPRRAPYILLSSSTTIIH